MLVDSIIFVDNKRNPAQVETGILLGEWASEMGQNEHIQEFVTTG